MSEDERLELLRTATEVHADLKELALRLRRRLTSKAPATSAEKALQNHFRGLNTQVVWVQRGAENASGVFLRGTGKELVLAVLPPSPVAAGSFVDSNGAFAWLQNLNLSH